MNDPHVATLKYRLVVDEPLQFHDPPDVEISTLDFTGRLSGGSLRLEPRGHFETESEVRPLADAYVAAWEIDAGLRCGPKFHFLFEGSEIVDRQPTPGTIAVTLADSLSHTSVDSLSVTVTLSAYPNPPQAFVVTPEVEILWARYCQYVANREPLTGMAYFNYTVIKATAGSIRNAAQHFGIQEKVLKRLGELSSERGDNLIARKVTPRRKPLSQIEKNWVECAIKAIIRQLATRQSGTRLMMSDLPPL